MGHTKMPLRDWLAGQAIAGLCADRHHGDTQGNALAIARFATEIADAAIVLLHPPEPPKRCGRTACDEDARPGGFCDEHTPF